ncbi:MAG: ABC transporter permease, partial [Pseudomonadota bacterium]
HGLMKFGGTLYVPKIVALSITREMAPIFTSLLVAGRIGSGIAAEIGSMAVTQQIDALRALGTSPVRVLVVPRVLAALISLPLLSTLSTLLGILGGLIVCVSDFGIPPETYFAKVIETIKIRDFAAGFLKASFFAIIITIVACYRALKTRDGTKGVGASTTWVVVTSSILILVSDFFLSKIFIILFL